MVDWKRGLGPLLTKGSAVSRRSFLQWLGTGTAVAVAGRWLPDCLARAASPLGELTLLVAANFAIRTLDPGRTLETTSTMVNHAMYDSLVTFEGEDLKTPKPSLAAAWTISRDGKAYTFMLRSNVNFASGNVLTSADVKWSFDRVMNLETETRFLLDGVDEVEAPDPRRVVIRLKKPRPSLLPILSSPSLSVLDSRLLMEKGGDAGPDAKSKDGAEPYLNAQSAGTGGFSLFSYVPNREVTLAKNPNHWRGAPRIDRVVIRNITDLATQQLQLEKGDLDIATGLGRDQMQALRQSSGVTAKVSPLTTTVYLAMHTSPAIGGAFANPRVQHAVRYALDYNGIMEIAGPGAVRLAGVIPVTLPGALDPKEAVRTDHARARALLKETGLQVQGRLTYPSDRVVGGVQINLLAQKIQADLALVGIQLDLNGLPTNVYLQQSREGRPQVSIHVWRADYPDASDFLPFLPGKLISKRVGWAADTNQAARELAALGDAAESEEDPQKRQVLYQRIERRLAQIGPFIPLFQPSAPYAFRSNIQGVTFNGVWGPDFFAITKAT